MKALGKGSIASLVRIGLIIAWAALWVAAVALVLAMLGYCVVLVMIQNGSIDPSVLGGGEGEMRDGEATWPVVIPALLIGMVAVAGYLVIVGRLRRLFDSFASGEPFRRENTKHLRVIWIAMLAIEVARYLLMALTGVLITMFEPNVQASFDFGVDISAWASILIVIVLAEVFREGARLKEEQELTI